MPAVNTPEDATAARKSAMEALGAKLPESFILVIHDDGGDPRSNAIAKRLTEQDVALWLEDKGKTYREETFQQWQEETWTSRNGKRFHGNGSRGPALMDKLAWATGSWKNLDESEAQAA